MKLTLIKLAFIAALSWGCGEAEHSGTNEPESALASTSAALSSTGRRIPVRFVQFAPRGADTVLINTRQQRLDELNEIYASSNLWFYTHANHNVIGTQFSGLSNAENYEWPTDLTTAPPIAFRPDCKLVRPPGGVETELSALFRAGSYCARDGELLVYIANSTNFGSTAGYPWGANAVVMSAGNMVDTTFAHEVGHYLGLPHVFLGGGGGYDLVAAYLRNPETGGVSKLSDFWDLVYRPGTSSATPHAYFSSRAEAAAIPESQLFPIQFESNEGEKLADGRLSLKVDTDRGPRVETKFTGDAALKGLAFTATASKPHGVNVMSYNYNPPPGFERFELSASQREQIKRVLKFDIASEDYPGTTGRRPRLGRSPMDVVSPAFNDDNGWGSVKYYASIAFPDINADAQADICARGNLGITCAKGYMSGKHAFFWSPTVWNSAFSDAFGWDRAEHYYSTIRFVDVDGDSKQDVCGRGAGGVSCAISNGLDAFVSTSVWAGSFSDGAGWTAAKYYETLEYPQLDGAGGKDICGRGELGVWCGKSDGSSFTDLRLWESSLSDAAGFDQPKYYRTIAYPDLNGDGRDDICVRRSSGIWCALSNGDSAFTGGKQWSTFFSDSGGWDQPKYYETIAFAKINDDDLPDVCGRFSDGIYCAMNNGSGFGSPARRTSGFGAGWDAGYYSSIVFIDKDRDEDRLVDVCGRGKEGVYCAYSNGAAFVGYGIVAYEPSNENGWHLPSFHNTLRFAEFNTDLRGLEVCGRTDKGILCDITISDD